MNDLEKIRNWLNTYPGIGKLGDLQVDFFKPAPDNGSIAPSGLVEISRTRDIMGTTTVENQYNFELLFMLFKDPGNDDIAADNAAFVMDLQRWVQEQSIRHLVPTFGDEPETETARAQNGQIVAADEEGTAIYSVQLSINFTKITRSESLWLI